MKYGSAMNSTRSTAIAIAIVASALLGACSENDAQPPAPVQSSEIEEEVIEVAEMETSTELAAMRSFARAVLGMLPEQAPNPENPITAAKVSLGRTLYYDTRLSKNHDISCNTCHLLDSFGVDGAPTSTGHRGQVGGRNAPTVYNAALHITQFWDGRAADVEEQAKGPVLNPIEMAMPSEDAVVAVLASIPGYAPLFADAFPENDEPLSYDNMARAIGAFERELLTPSVFDAFLAGDDDAMSAEQIAGLDVFLSSGCIACHQGVAIGGSLYRKLGMVEPYPTEDPGRQAITGDDADLHVFKVPSLRNIARTGPYFHDGSIESLDEVIRLMARYQLGTTLDEPEVTSIRNFLDSLTGVVEERQIEMPVLPPSGPNTPAPDPS
jgi:cytochrome c peroxidase